jgi:hypothetical protein
MPEPLTLNLFEQQAANRRKSWLLIGGFLAFFLWLGLGGDLIAYLSTQPVEGTAPYGYVHRVPWLGIIMGGIAIWLIMDVLRNGAKKVLWTSGAQPLAASTPEERQFENVVEEMAIAAGIPKPKLYVVPDADPNAFVTGTGPLEAHLAVTQGLLAVLTREEMQAVVAHEMGHVKNEDTKLMTMVAGLAGAILLLRDGVGRSFRMTGRIAGRSRGGGKKEGNPLISGPHRCLCFVLDPRPPHRSAHGHGDQPEARVLSRCHGCPVHPQPGCLGRCTRQDREAPRPHHHAQGGGGPPMHRGPRPADWRIGARGGGPTCSAPTRRWRCESRGSARWPFRPRSERVTLCRDGSQAYASLVYSRSLSGS